MKTEEENKNIEILIGKSLNDSAYPDISTSFTDRLMVKIEQQLAWKNIMTEFFWKAAIVLILLLFAAGILFIPQFKDFLIMVVNMTPSWQMIVYPVILVTFTIVFDQVFLKYLFFRKKQ